jgi:hypothetical protein
MRGAALLIGLLGLMALAGCSTKSTSVVSTRRATSCLPHALTLFGPRPIPPKELRTPLEARLISEFALLRRSRLPADDPSRGDLEGLTLSVYLAKTYTLASFYPAYVRVLDVSSHGHRYYVVPAFGRPEALLPGCAPASLRRGMVERQRNRLSEPVYCVIEVGVRARTPVPGCEAFAQVGESLSAFHVSDLVGDTTVELVPDGVASVRVIYAGRAPIVVPVRENAFLLTPPPAPHDRLTAYLRALLAGFGDKHVTKAQRLTAARRWNAAFAGTYPTRIEWLNGAGAVVRAINRPDESASRTSVGDLRAPVEG